MSVGNEIAYRRSSRGRDATGSLVFDQERKQSVKDAPAEQKSDKPRAAKPVI